LSHLPTLIQIIHPDAPSPSICHHHSQSAAQTASNSLVRAHHPAGIAKHGIWVHSSCWMTTTDTIPHWHHNMCVFGLIYSLTCLHWLILSCYSLSPQPLIFKVVCLQPRDEESQWFSNPWYIYCPYCPQGCLLMFVHILSSHKSTFGATSMLQIIPHVGQLSHLITVLTFTGRVSIGIHDNQTNSDLFLTWSPKTANTCYYAKDLVKSMMQLMNKVSAYTRTSKHGSKLL
jgi:hypothetical protein